MNVRKIVKEEVIERFGKKGNVIFLLQQCIYKCDEENYEIDNDIINRKAVLFLNLDEESELYNMFIFSAKMVHAELKQKKFNRVVIDFINNFYKLESFFSRNLKSIEVKDKDVKNPGVRIQEKVMVRLKDESNTHIYLGELKGAVAKKIIKDIRAVKEVKI